MAIVTATQLQRAPAARAHESRLIGNPPLKKHPQMSLRDLLSVVILSAVFSAGIRHLDPPPFFSLVWLVVQAVALFGIASGPRHLRIGCLGFWTVCLIDLASDSLLSQSLFATVVRRIGVRALSLEAVELGTSAATGAVALMSGSAVFLL